jgi:hypothetical protein
MLSGLFSASLAHVYPPSSWSVPCPVVFIYPSSIGAPSCIPSLFSSAITSTFTPQALSHSFTLLTLLPFPRRRTPLQSEFHSNDFPFCPLASPIPSGSCVCDIAIREQTGAAFVLITLLSVSFRNLVYPSGTVSFRFLCGSNTQSYTIFPVCLRVRPGNRWACERPCSVYLYPSTLWTRARYCSRFNADFHFIRWLLAARDHAVEKE